MLFQSQPSKLQPHKMVKNTETIRRLLPMYCLSLFLHFVRLALKGLSSNRNVRSENIVIKFQFGHCIQRGKFTMTIP